MALTERSLMDVQVGDTLVVMPKNYSRTPRQVERYVVTKVARKYLTADRQEEWKATTDFRRADGHERAVGGYSNYLADAFTIDGIAVHEARRRAEERVQPLRRGHGMVWEDMSCDQLERIADIFEETPDA
jgi:hypothetical protein